MKLRKNKIALAAAACTLLVTNAAHSAVIVTFVEVGSDVVATWTGSLDIGSVWWQDITLTRNEGGATWLYAQDGQVEVWNNPLAFASTTSLSMAPTSSTGGSFGFLNNEFTWAGSDNNMAPVSNIANFDSGSYTMTWAGQTLSSIGADSFGSGTLAWTSGVGGTNTVTFTSVPEPSAALLSSFGLLALLRRKR